MLQAAQQTAPSSYTNNFFYSRTQVLLSEARVKSSRQVQKTSLYSVTLQFCWQPPFSKAHLLVRPSTAHCRCIIATALDLCNQHQPQLSFPPILESAAHSAMCIHGPKWQPFDHVSPSFSQTTQLADNKASMPPVLAKGVHYYNY